MDVNWLNEAVSNYVVFIAGIVVGAIAWALRAWWTKRRPSHVRVERVNVASLLEIAPEARTLLKVTQVATLLETEAV